MAELINTTLINDSALQLYYRFENNVNDSSGKGNDGSATNITYTSGKFGNAGSFNGTSTYIDTGINFSSYSSLSVTAWYLPNDTSKQRALSNDDAGFDDSIQLGINPDGGGDTKFGATHQNSIDSQKYHVVDTSVASTVSYTHMVYVYDGTTLQLYINGSLVDTNSKSGLTYNSNNVYIGRRFLDAEQFYYGGTIDDLGIFNKALSEPEVLELYQDATTQQTMVGFFNV